MKEQKQSCLICFTPSVPIHCPYCGYSSCKKCWTSYFYELLHSMKLPCCINQSCKKSFQFSFLSFFTKKFFSEYFRSLAKIIYYIDTKSFSNYIDIVKLYINIKESTIEIEKIKNWKKRFQIECLEMVFRNKSKFEEVTKYEMFKELCDPKSNKKLKTRITLLQNIMLTHKLVHFINNILKRDFSIDNLFETHYKSEDFDELLKLFRSHFSEMNDKDSLEILIYIINIDLLSSKSYKGKINMWTQEIQEKKRLITFMYKNFREDTISTVNCVSPYCKGILDKNHICIFCHCFNCSKCGIVTSKNHGNCSEEDIKTYESLVDCKRCPHCKEWISKSDGCNTMWCTQCHTFFDYATGSILIGNDLHNPEHIDFLNQENTCDNDLHLMYIPVHVQGIYVIDQIVKDFYVLSNKDVIFKNEINLRWILEKIELYSDKKMLYIQFLAKAISEEYLIDALSKYEKKKMIWKEHYELVHSFLVQFSSLYDTNIPVEYETLVHQWKNHANQSIKKLSYLNGSNLPFIHFYPSTNVSKNLYLSTQSPQ